MKTIMLTLALATMALTSCKTATTTTDTTALKNLRYEISWKAFCETRGYDLNDMTYTATNEYLDAWVGSVEEEEAFIKAGVEPY